LIEHQAAGALRFACRLGHSFSAEELLALFERATEERTDLAAAGKLELLAEYAGLARRLARWSRRQGLAEPAAELEERAREAEQQAWRLRERLL
jgi:hypothetical protein